MSHPSIGGIDFLTARGSWPTDPKEALGNITRARVNGVAFEKLGLHADPVQIVTEADVDDADSTMASYLALQGTLVTVEDADGASYANVAVLKVTKILAKKVLSPQGGLTAGDWMLTAHWLLQATAV